MTSTDTTTVIDAEPASNAGAAPTNAATAQGAPAAQPAAPGQTLGSPVAAQQQPVGYPGTPVVERKPDTAFAITSFVLGVASVISSWTFVAPIIGLVFGILALRRQTKERPLALWGVWLNGAMLVLTALVMLGVIAVASFGFLAGLPHWVID